MAKIKHNDKTKCWKRHRETGSLIAVGKVIGYIHSKRVFPSFIKLSKYEPNGSAIELLGIYLREVKTYVKTKTCTQMYIAALFIIDNNWMPFNR